MKTDAKTKAEKLQARACARFFVRVGGQSTQFRVKDTETRPLFTLPMIMKAEGLLAKDVRALL